MIKNIDELVYDLKEHLDTYCQTYDDYDMTYNQTEMIYYLIKNLEQENKKYKEVINKAIKYIEENKQHEYRNGNFNEYYLELNEKEMTELLDILKEVEHEKN